MTPKLLNYIVTIYLIVIEIPGLAKCSPNKGELRRGIGPKRNEFVNREMSLLLYGESFLNVAYNGTLCMLG